MLEKLRNSLWTAVLWTAVIFILLSMHTGTVESLPFLGFRHWDKYVHVFLFAVLVWLWLSYLHARGKLRKNTLWITVLLCILYGTGMEYYQKYFTTREFETLDIFSDGLGAFLGAVYFWKKNKPLWK
jgi:hypothetical protein